MASKSMLLSLFEGYGGKPERGWVVRVSWFEPRSETRLIVSCTRLPKTSPYASLVWLLPAQRKRVLDTLQLSAAGVAYRKSKGQTKTRKDHLYRSDFILDVKTVCR